MSEINCCGDEIVYGEVVEHWCLVQLKNVVGEYKVNDNVMKEEGFLANWLLPKMYKKPNCYLSLLL